MEGEIVIFKKLMALYYKFSPVCWLTRKKPESPFVKLIFWHGDWCPFKRAYADLYGNMDKK